VTTDQVVAVATAIVLSLGGAVGLLYRALLAAKDQTVSLVVSALKESIVAHHDAASAMTRQSEAINGLSATLNASLLSSSREHSSLLSEIRAQRKAPRKVI